MRDSKTLDGERVVKAMRAGTIDDPLFGTVRIRADGRALHAMYLFRVKRPAESRAAWDYYDLVQMIPSEQAFRPITDGGCKLALA